MGPSQPQKWNSRAPIEQAGFHFLRDVSIGVFATWGLWSSHCDFNHEGLGANQVGGERGGMQVRSFSRRAAVALSSQLARSTRRVENFFTDL
jgi:hypothetical protein